MFYKLVIIGFTLKNLLVPSFGEKKNSGFKSGKHGYSISKIAQLPDSVREGSALEAAKEGESFWTMGDSGTKSQLFEFDKEGRMLSVLPLKLRNRDWEDMTKDDDGNIYIGDFGNNFSNRKDLVIYKLSKSFDTIQPIHFTYEDQTEFPAEMNNLNFDCESMIYYKDSLYLFSKNRGDKWMKIYSLPNKPGNYQAKIVQKVYINSRITGADINSDNNMVVLLTYGKIYFLHVDSATSGLKLKPYFKKTFNRSIQSEGVLFINNTDLLISNEQGQLFIAKKKKSY